MDSRVVFNGVVMDRSAVHVNLDNRAMRYGDGLFESMRWVAELDDVPLWVYHLERLREGALLLGYELPDPEVWREAIEQVAPEHDAFMRLMLWRQGGGTYASDVTAVDWLLEVRPLLETEPLQLGVLDAFPKPLSPIQHIKTSASLYYVMASRQAAARHWNEAILLSHGGWLCETLYCNLWWYMDGQWFTPSLESGCVSGSARRYIKSRNSQIWEVLAPPAMLDQAESIGLSNGVRGWRYLTEWNGRPLLQKDKPAEFPF